MKKVTYHIIALSVALFIYINTSAQTISTIAGCGIGDDSIATRCELADPFCIAIDHSGNTYIGDGSDYRIRKITPAGLVSTIAGTGVRGNTGDGGPATAAQIGLVYGICVDKFENIYFADIFGNCIRKINTSGIISTIAGNGIAGFSGDSGQATAAQLNNPYDVVADTSGNLYIADQVNNRVRKVNSSGIITTITGNGSPFTTGTPGPATAASIGAPYRLAIDKYGNLYIGESVFICKIDTANIIRVLAGNGTYATGTDYDGGPATNATMTLPFGLAVDTSGNLYFSDTYNFRVRHVDMNTGIITNFAGSGTRGYGGDTGPATAAKENRPAGLACDAAGNVYLCDNINNKVRKVSTTGIITTYAGQNGLFAEGYPAVNAEMCLPYNICLDANSNIYIADFRNNRVRKIDANTGLMTTVAGSGIAGITASFSGDGGPATLADILGPAAVAADTLGNIFIASISMNRVLKVDATEIITTIAGTGTTGFSGDNMPATAAKISVAYGVAVDNGGNVFIADMGNHRIRKVNNSGIISTVAGGDTVGYTGDGGPATAALLGDPNDVATDNLGNFYFCDVYYNCIRKVDASGIITTVAGTGVTGFSGDGGPATAAQINDPSGVKADPYGNIFFTDEGNQRVRMVSDTGTISTIAGIGTAGFSGDGDAPLAAQLNWPSGIATDNKGDFYVADGYNYRIRKFFLQLPHLSIPVANNTKIAVFPNPAHNILNIRNASNDHFSIADLSGKVLINKEIISITETIDISKLPSGIYIVTISGKNTLKRTFEINKN